MDSFLKVLRTQLKVFSTLVRFVNNAPGESEQAPMEGRRPLFPNTESRDVAQTTAR